MDGASGKGGDEPSRRRFRVIDYEERSGEPIRRWSIVSRIRRCTRCQTYSYINHMIVAVLDKGGSFRRATTRDQTEMVRLSGIMRMQADRIREL